MHASALHPRGRVKNTEKQNEGNRTGEIKRRREGSTHPESHHEAAGRALAAVEQARPLEPDLDVVQVQILPAGLALPAVQECKEDEL